jgi:hypothetical protein
VRITRFDTLQFIVEAARQEPSAKLKHVLEAARELALNAGDTRASRQLDGLADECETFPCQRDWEKR